MENTISFETAVLLKNLGFQQKTFLCYNRRVLTFIKHLKGLDVDFVSAPTFEEISIEIFNFLPKTVENVEIQITDNAVYLNCDNIDYNWNVYYFNKMNIVEALAKIYIKLKENL